jgi:cytochrome c peroxidase
LLLYQQRNQWTAAEQQIIRGLWLATLPPLPPDPSNRYADNAQVAALGEKLFFDTRLSSNGQVACATCHQPALSFQDGLPLAQGVGTTDRRAMPLVGTAYSPWFFWDGRKDSQWAQALGPLENPVEHGGNRTLYAQLVAQHYREEYEPLFGPLPDLSAFPTHAASVTDPETLAAWAALSPEAQTQITQIFVNIGKAIAAYERTLRFAPTRFDRYAEAIVTGDGTDAQVLLTDDEIAGLRLFIGKAACTNCHNGPLFTNNDFHNTGVPAVATLPEDMGRARGAQQVLADEFNCLSQYSDADPSQCAELRFMVAEGHELVRQYKPPSLRDVAARPPYMHAGQFASLAQVLDHYNRAPAAPAGHSELEPLNLSAQEQAQLIAFLQTLSSVTE